MEALAGLRAWIITDGKAGDENQCLGIAQCLDLVVERRRIPATGPFALLAPWGPADPRERRPGGALHGPLPALIIASGRRSVPYLRACRRIGVGFTAFLKDPRTGAGSADFIWVPQHDALRGPGVFTTVTSPHLVSARRLAEARPASDPRFGSLAGRRVAVLLGGDSRHLRFTEDEIARLIGGLHQLVAERVSLMVTASRRTPRALQEAAQTLVCRAGGFYWNGQGENPYVAMLASAEAVVVTSDSVNMVSEAVATGVPVLLHELAGTPICHRHMYDALKKAGALASFDGRLTDLRYTPIDATPVIAQALADAYIRHRGGRI